MSLLWGLWVSSGDGDGTGNTNMVAALRLVTSSGGDSSK